MIRRFFFGLAAQFLVSSFLIAGDWPQWRGPNGSGVSTETNLPERWGKDSPAIRWSIAVPGTGHSSPIVSNGKVFLTTALDGNNRVFTVLAWAIAATGAVMAALFFASFFGTLSANSNKWSRWPTIGRFVDASLSSFTLIAISLLCASALTLETSSIHEWLVFPGGKLTVLQAVLALVCVTTLVSSLQTNISLILRLVDASVACAATVLVYLVESRLSSAWVLREHDHVLAILFLVVFAVATTLRRVLAASEASIAERVGRGLHLVEKTLVVFASTVFVVALALTLTRPEAAWPAGAFWPIWKVSGLIASFGLVAGVGSLPSLSRWRLPAALLLIVFGGVLFRFAPEGQGGERMAMVSRVFLGAPAVLAGCWYLVGSIIMSRLAERQQLSRFAMAVSGTLLGVMALLYFGAANFFQPEIQRVVMCVDLDSGRTLWQKAVISKPRETKHPSNSFATPTPATDGKRVVAYFGWGVACLDQSGGILWTKFFDDYAVSSTYGVGSSPVIAGNKVIIPRDSERPDYLWSEAGYQGQPSSRRSREAAIVALDLETGAVVWEVKRRDTRDSYSTPVVVSHGSSKQLITVTAKRIIAYDIDTGRELWLQQTTMPQIGTSPVQADGVVWAAAGASHVDPGASVVAVRFGNAKSELLWSSKRAVPTCVSPVVHNGKLYTLTYNGILTRYDAASGAVQCTRRLVAGQYFASLSVADGKLYATSDEGVTSVLAADGECNVLAENDLQESVMASPAIADGNILLRTASRLVCLRK